eukprot:TRINITY_DN3025_c0_g1_i1.p1 TRINITY_DN3025_c0_g1~~TRINITY_DN3025_c0_g1_i1.p1  ORF type:complete len:696 (+),score=206.19 TRINITY_DN3025_c0_g1_i1:87-2174(+)
MSKCEDGECTLADSALLAVDWMLSNQLIATALLAAATAGLYYAYATVREALTRMLLVRLSIFKDDEAFNWVMSWLAAQESFRETGQTFTLKVVNTKTRNFWQATFGDDPGADQKELNFQPGLGYHAFRYTYKTQGGVTRTARITLHRDRNENATQAQSWSKPFTPETITLCTLGRDKTPLKHFIADCMRAYYARNNNKTRIFVLSEGAWDWEEVLVKEPRSLDSVILDEGVGSRLVSDVEKFMASQKWYEERGIPYRRGYLLYGPPGCGKSSFASALAGHVGAGVCCLTLTNSNLDDQKLNMRLHDSPPKSVILLEDVDAVFVKRETSDTKKLGVSFSGLLNAIDGVAAQEGRILIMTTNHKEKLDPALIRPGRCDFQVRFNLATRHQLRRMFQRFFPEALQLAEEFAEAAPENTLSLARVQTLLMDARGAPESAIVRVKDLAGRDEDDQHLGAPTKKTSVHEWLRRLGLIRYHNAFKQRLMATVDDLTGLSDQELQDMGVDARVHRQRCLSMLEGKEQVRRDWQFITSRSQVKSVLQNVWPDTGEDLMAAYADRFPLDKFSIFEFEDLLKVVLVENLADIDAVLATLEERATASDDVGSGFPRSQTELAAATFTEGSGSDIRRLLIAAGMAGEALEEAMGKFDEQAVHTRRDLALIDAQTLEKEFGVKKLGHRLRLQRLLKMVTLERQSAPITI